MQIINVQVGWSEEAEYEGVKIRPSVMFEAALDGDDDTIVVVTELLDEAREHVLAALRHTIGIETNA